MASGRRQKRAVRVTVLFFAAAREAAGCQRAQLDLPEGATAGEAMAAVLERYPALERFKASLQLAVDREVGPLERKLHEGAELALLPPVAGGSDDGLDGRLRLSDEPLVIADAERLVAAPGFGGIVTFAGTVRNETDGRRVLRLEYEAYAPMALKQMHEIAAQLEAKHGTRMAMFHRVGLLDIGDIAVIVSAAAPHRGPAFRACEEGIATLKAEAAIWKREIYADGSSWIGLGA
jgi:molybdopterin synthase catalytic subunit